MTATAIYRAVMLEVERRRLQLGIPMWQLDDMAGTQDGYYAKMLHVDSPSGRQARWESLQMLMDAMFPEGFDVAIKPGNGSCSSALQQKHKMRFAVALNDRKHQRLLMSELGRKGGRAPRRRLPTWKRKQIARAGGRAKARRYARLASVAPTLILD